jgi:hypothetical protein
MGHILLGPIPRTREWKQVVALIEHGAGVEQVANATIRAAETGLRRAADDQGVIHALWLLFQLPLSARCPDFAQALRDRGLTVSDSPGLMEIIGGVADNIDAQMFNHRGRSDLSEMAQSALAETIAQIVGVRSDGLFGITPEVVRANFAKLATVKQLGIIARSLFARFVNKCLAYYLSRALADLIGPGRRFATLAQQSTFSEALEKHCHEASLIVERFAGEWFSKTKHEEGDIDREAASHFAYGAVHKLIDELRRGAGLDGN